MLDKIRKLSLRITYIIYHELSRFSMAKKEGVNKKEIQTQINSQKDSNSISNISMARQE